jgi:hypothetical protein
MERMMAFEPFGYGDRWYDRLGGRGLKPKEFTVLLLVIVIVGIIWELS